ncbi:MAG TPA: DUF2304 domain-containing protein [Phycisphaerae bacterium]|jgi:hypothetical protein|nr:DUF2304 domain-containing protein [Phycisphaerae bacterium]
MTIKIILTLLLGTLALYAARNMRGALAPIALSFIAASLAGVFFVWNPQAANNVAALVGIGRGADLIFYFGFIFGLFSIFVLHLRIALLNRQLTVLARHIALNAAREHPASGPHEDSVHASAR